MQRLAGWVLAGGYGRRLGADKALLLLDGEPLAIRAAKLVSGAAGPVTIVGRAKRFSKFGFPAIDDLEPGNGPLGGIVTALRATGAEWNLICACDLPRLDAALLQALVTRTTGSAADAVVPRAPDGKAQPLCAMYRSSSVEALDLAYRDGERAVWRALTTVNVEWMETSGDSWAFNLNTPQDLSLLHQDPLNVG